MKPASENRHADLLIRNGIVLTLNPDFEIITPGAVAVIGTEIIAVGPDSDFTDWNADKVIDARKDIVLPGLVNLHTHAAMTCFRGIADDLPLMTWLQEHIFPAESKLTRDRVYAGTLLACAEMIMSGTTCFCDMYLFEDAVAEAAKSAGMRAVVGEVLYDFPSPHYGTIDRGFQFTEDLIRKWTDDPLITIAVEPHSPYLCAPELLQEAAKLSRKYAVPLVIHVSETDSEVEQMLERYGKRPVRHLADLDVLGPNLVACHCVAMDADDIALLARTQTRVAHNPESNMKLASGIAPVPDMMNAGICVGLGTDGCSSNNNLDLFSEMDMTAKLHKVAKMDPTVMDAGTVLRMTTLGGAQALGMDHRIGSLEPGKQADIIIVDTTAPHMRPMYHPESHLVYSARGNDVVTTVIAGNVVMENRELRTMDAEQAADDVMTIAREIRAEVSGR